MHFSGVCREVDLFDFLDSQVCSSVSTRAALRTMILIGTLVAVEEVKGSSFQSPSSQ